MSGRTGRSESSQAGRLNLTWIYRQLSSFCWSMRTCSACAVPLWLDGKRGVRSAECGVRSVENEEYGK